MKGGVGVANKLRLIVFLASVLFLWDAKSTLAGSEPTKTGKKESVQKQTGTQNIDI